MIAVLASCLLAPGALGIRQARVDLAPPEPLPLGGYTERGAALVAPGGDVLFSQTTILQQGGLRVALTTVETLTIPESLVSAVQERIPKDVRLLLMASHTHCAPDSQMLNERMTMPIPGIATFRRRWLDWYADHIASGIRAALQAPSRTAILQISLDRALLNHGRRPGAVPSTRLVRVWETGAERPLFAHYAAHATIFGPSRLQTSGDWPGAVMRAGGGQVLVGAIGDVSPGGPAGANPGDRVAAFVSVFALQPRQRRPIASKLGWATAPIDLGKPVPHPTFASAYKVVQPLAEAAVARFAPLKAEVSVVRIGKVAIVGTPAEPSAEVGRQIEAAGRSAGFETVLVVSHANGWIGYVLQPEDYDRGGYEATLSFFGRDLAPRLVDAARRALVALARNGAR